MESFLLTFLLTNFLFFTSSTAISTTKTSSAATYRNYLKSACNTTTYPTLCYRSLSSYASKIKTNNLRLCTTALSVALKGASNTSSLVKKLSKQKNLTKIEASIVKDCIDEIGDTIDELKDSVAVMGNLTGYPDVEFQLDNVKTWVSAAITDENTCTDGVDDGKKNISSSVKNKIRSSILNVARLTSNALSLINKLKY